MSYRLNLDAEVPEAVRAVAVEQLDDALTRLREQRDDDPVEAVHEARKDLKKTRSLLRLVRPDMKGKSYRRENDQLRDIARSLSAARDADVMIETVDKLRERFVGRLPARAFTTLRRRLQAEARAAREQADGAISGEVLHSLDAAVARVGAWKLDGCDARTLPRGAQRAYRRGIATFARAEDEPTVEHLHEWRKRVKDLWYHQRLLSDAWPGLLEASADEAHDLSDLLGDDHDLAVLADRLATGHGPAGRAPVDDASLRELIAERRLELQAEARTLGRRLYAESPKAYRRRLRSYLEAARTARPVPELA
jgi:CHAD domain-containing protein